jgi:hypothetical protein
LNYLSALARRLTKKHRATLAPEELTELRRMVTAGRTAARKLNHSRILLKADEGGSGPALPDDAVADALKTAPAPIAHVRRQFVEVGLDAAVAPRPMTRAYARKLDRVVEARAVTLPRCGRGGRSQFLADQIVVLGFAEEGLSYEAVRRTLKKRA